MVLQTQNAGFSPKDAFDAIRLNGANYKAQAQHALTTMQNGSVDSNFVLNQLLPGLVGAKASLNAWIVNSTSLNDYATAQGYIGQIVADVNAVTAAITSAITSIVTAFPTDTGGFIQAYTLGADGTLTPRSFTSAQTNTAGIQTALSNLIATIS